MLLDDKKIFKPEDGFPPMYLCMAEPKILDDFCVQIDYCYARSDDDSEDIKIESPIVIDLMNVSKINGSDGTLALIDIHLYALGKPTVGKHTSGYFATRSYGHFIVPRTH